MVLLLKGVQGPYQNRYFRLKAGMVLGRKQGDILLEEDPMVSSLHGYVIARQSGVLSLEDAGSQNQFLVKGQKVAKLDLRPGVVFQVGRCTFEVVALSEEEARKVSSLKGWRDLVLESLEKNVSLDPSPARALSPMVRIEGVKGPNAEDIWVLGFGPRLFGPLSEDIEILEKDCADVGFEILQGPTGPQVKARTSKAWLNMDVLRLEIGTNLADGDEIRIGSSVFKVRFI